MLPSVYRESDLCACVIQSYFNVFQVFRCPVIPTLDYYLTYGKTARHLRPLVHIKPQRGVCLPGYPAAVAPSFLLERSTETALQDVPFQIETTGGTGQHISEIRRNVSLYDYITIIFMQMDCVPETVATGIQISFVVIYRRAVITFSNP